MARPARKCWSRISRTTCSRSSATKLATSSRWQRSHVAAAATCRSSTTSMAATRTSLTSKPKAAPRCLQPTIFELAIGHVLDAREYQIIQEKSTTFSDLVEPLPGKTRRSPNVRKSRFAKHSSNTSSNEQLQVEVEIVERLATDGEQKFKRIVSKVEGRSRQAIHASKKSDVRIERLRGLILSSTTHQPPVCTHSKPVFSVFVRQLRLCGTNVSASRSPRCMLRSTRSQFSVPSQFVGQRSNHSHRRIGAELRRRVSILASRK